MRRTDQERCEFQKTRRNSDKQNSDNTKVKLRKHQGKIQKTKTKFRKQKRNSENNGEVRQTSANKYAIQKADKKGRPGRSGWSGRSGLLDAGWLEDGTHHERRSDADGWKMALTMNVTSASADPDIEVWMSWLACAFVVNPDLDFLANSAGERFAMMDIKLALSLQTMLRSAPDDAKGVVHDIQPRTTSDRKQVNQGKRDHRYHLTILQIE